MSGKVKAFAYFGTKLTNVRWSWSARSDDGKTVVLSLWSDRFRWKDKPLRYDGRERVLPDDWMSRPGMLERLENLRWARDNCGGLFRVVLAIAVDTNAEPRDIATCFSKDWVMRITELNEETGEFQAVLVEGET